MALSPLPEEALPSEFPMPTATEASSSAPSSAQAGRRLGRRKAPTGSQKERLLAALRKGFTEAVIEASRKAPLFGISVASAIAMEVFVDSSKEIGVFLHGKEIPVDNRQVVNHLGHLRTKQPEDLSLLAQGLQRPGFFETSFERRQVLRREGRDLAPLLRTFSALQTEGGVFEELTLIQGVDSSQAALMGVWNRRFPFLFQALGRPEGELGVLEALASRGGHGRVVPRASELVRETAPAADWAHPFILWLPIRASVQVAGHVLQCAERNLARNLLTLVAVAYAWHVEFSLGGRRVTNFLYHLLGLKGGGELTSEMERLIGKVERLEAKAKAAPRQ